MGLCEPRMSKSSLLKMCTELHFEPTAAADEKQLTAWIINGLWDAVLMARWMQFPHCLRT